MNNNRVDIYHALTVAGSDSCGGAGIQADLKTINALGVQAATAITAITAQNTAGVSRVQVMDAEMVQAQLVAVTNELPIKAAKTGMLANAEIIEVLIKHLADQSDLDLIVDPVMVATSGARLLDQEAESVLREGLLPKASLVTPNLPEAAVLTELDDDRPAEEYAEALIALGCRAVLIKGGHGSGDHVEDLLVTEAATKRYKHPRRPLQVHGTGCALSAAITACLARGSSLENAVDQAIAWLQQQLDQTWTVPRGKLAMLPFTAG